VSGTITVCFWENLGVPGVQFRSVGSGRFPCVICRLNLLLVLAFLWRFSFGECNVYPPELRRKFSKSKAPRPAWLNQLGLMWPPLLVLHFMVRWPSVHSNYQRKKISMARNCNYIKAFDVLSFSVNYNILYEEFILKCIFIVFFTANHFSTSEKSENDVWQCISWRVKVLTRVFKQLPLEVFVLMFNC